MSDHQRVAAEVRAEMARQQLSGVRAAKELGWTQNYISRRLSGTVPFDVADLMRLAGLLEVPVESFFESRTRHRGSTKRYFAPAQVKALGLAA